MLVTWWWTTKWTVYSCLFQLFIRLSGYYMYQQVWHTKILRSAHSVFMCFVWIWEQTAIISLYSINRLIFITETEYVYCAVRTEYLNLMQFKWNDKIICFCCVAVEIGKAQCDLSLQAFPQVFLHGFQSARAHSRSLMPWFFWYDGAIEARLWNNCCRGKAISITYSECVSVVLVIQQAMLMSLMVS
jgi:hypothetical protein